MLPEVQTVVAEKYEIVERIGSGAMGTVYKAVHRAMNRTVALKFVHQGMDDNGAMERFKREAKILATLQHKNLVACYELGLWQNHAFAAMEFVEGESLDVVLNSRGPRPVRDAINLATQICDGLAYAHKNGVVHRDIKPSNILIVDDVAKIIDFGLAKLDVPTGVSIMKLTETGFAVGTPQYMSPEQCVGQNVDARTDIYAVGVLLFQMIAGRPPFDGENAVEVMHQHFTVVPPLLSAQAPRVVLPPGLDTVVARCMDKDPAQRYQSAEELSHALHLVAEGQGLKVTQYIPQAPVVAEQKRRATRAPVFVAVCISLAILGAAAFLLNAKLNDSPSALIHHAREQLQNHEYRAAIPYLRRILQLPHEGNIDDGTLEECAINLAIANFIKHDTAGFDYAVNLARKYGKEQGAKTGALTRALAMYGNGPIRTGDMSNLLYDLGATSNAPLWSRTDADQLKFIGDDLGVQSENAAQFKGISRFDITRLKSGDSLFLFGNYDKAHDYYFQAAASSVPSIAIRGKLGLLRCKFSSPERPTLADLPSEAEVEALNDINILASYKAMKWRLETGIGPKAERYNVEAEQLGMRLVNDAGGRLTPTARADLTTYLHLGQLTLIPPLQRPVTGTEDWLEFWREYNEDTDRPLNVHREREGSLLEQ